MRYKSLLVSLGLALCLAGCNSGIASIFGAAEDSPADAPSSISGFSLSSTASAPATIRFRVLDGDGGTVSVALYYELSGGTPVLLSELGGESNPGSYGASATGVQHELLWDFPAEPDFPAEGSFVGDVTVFALISGAEDIQLDSNATLTGIGNDPPTVDNILVPAAEADGVVPLPFEVADSSGDIVNVRVEYRRAGDSAWELARLGGAMSTPDLAFTGISAESSGTPLTFFWDSDVDLPQEESEVQLRFTPIDPTLEGEPTLSPLFRIDNNESATLDLDSGVVTGNPDTSGGIAIPFFVRDPESDPVQVVFQWSPLGEDFPQLPESVSEIQSILQDAKQRAQYRIASERTSYVTGRPLPVDESHLRLPELGTSRIALFGDQLASREIEIHRPHERLEVASATWSSNSLTSPVAAHPLGDGLECLVLDEPTAGSHRLARIELATGELLETLHEGSGVPTALTVGVLEEHAFFASLDSGTWTVRRISLVDGTLDEVSSTSLDGEGIRGLAAASGATVFATLDDTVQELRFHDVNPTTPRTVISGLMRPCGIALDPQAHDQLLISDTLAGQVLRVHALKGTRRRLGDFPEPKGLTIDREGRRLLVTCADATGASLQGWNLRSTHDLDRDGLADRGSYQLHELPVGCEHVASGASETRLLVDESNGTLIAIGGIEQRRTIIDATNDSNVIALGEPLDPPLRLPDVAPRVWKIRRAPRFFPTSPSGVNHLYPWDSADMPMGGEVRFRGTPIDSEPGFSSATALPSTVRGALAIERTTLAPKEVFVAPIPTLVDFDADGDLDVLVSDGEGSRILLQTAPSVFAEPAPLPFVVGPSQFASILIQDLDGDGALDAAHLRTDRQIEVWYGYNEIDFVDDPELITVPGTPDTIGPVIINRWGSIEAPDMNGDGTPELLVSLPVLDPQAEELAQRVFVFHRSSNGFDTPPMEVGADDVTLFTHYATAGDIDGDGLQDIVSLNDGVPLGSFNPCDPLGNIAVHFQASDGSFPDTDFTVIAEPDPGFPLASNTGEARHVRIADMDSDGDMDLVSIHGKSCFIGTQAPEFRRRVTIHWQTSPRTFDPEPTVLEGLGADSSSDQGLGVAVADMNSDGRLDVLCLNTVAFLVWYASPAGGFDPQPVELEHGEGPAGFDFLLSAHPSHTIDPADVDGDGDLDFVYRNGRTRNVELVTQVGRGIEFFGGLQTLSPASGFTGAREFVPTDVDRDGDVDLVLLSSPYFTGQPGDSEVILIEQFAPRSFSTLANPIGTSDLSGAESMHVSDLNGNGRPDFVVASRETDQLVLFLQAIDGTFSDSIALQGVFNGEETTSQITYVNVGDLDLDGDLDLAALPRTGGVLMLFEQDRASNFIPSFPAQAPPILFSGAQGRGFALEDLTSDGILDVLAFGVPLKGDPIVTLSSGIGDGGFVPQIDQIDFNGTARPRVLDVDLDGVLDIVGRNLDGMVVAYGAGDGTYATRSYSLGPNPSVNLNVQAPEYQFADLDRDGDLDLAIIADDFVNPPVSLFEQIRPRVFAEVVSFELDVSSTSFVFHDLDQDGELDLMSSLNTGSSKGGRAFVVFGNN